MTWNYRVIRDKSGNLGVHEVYYGDNHMPHSYTENPISFGADVDEGIQAVIASLECALKNARELPILDASDFGKIDS